MSTFNKKIYYKKSAKPTFSHYYMYGRHAVLSALQNPKRTIKQVLCTKEVFDTNKDLINKYPHEIVTHKEFTKILGHNQNHQGIAAQVATIFSDNISLLASYNKIVILDQITDPQNIGSIIRSAAAFDIQAVVTLTDNMPQENATIAKAASGTLELVQIITVTNLKHVIDFLKTNGFWVIGLDGNANEVLNKSMYSSKLAIILGSEERGLRKLTMECCDYLAKIPISKKVESLNVSAAAAIAFSLTTI